MKRKQYAVFPLTKHTSLWFMCKHVCWSTRRRERLCKSTSPSHTRNDPTAVGAECCYGARKENPVSVAISARSPSRQSGAIPKTNFKNLNKQHVDELKYETHAVVAQWPSERHSNKQQLVDAKQHALSDSVSKHRVSHSIATAVSLSAAICGHLGTTHHTHTTLLLLLPPVIPSSSAGAQNFFLADCTQPLLLSCL